MAEVVGILGLIGSIIGILEGVNKTRAIFKKYVHKSSSLQKELVPVLGKLTAFTGILRGLQLECELDESNSARLEIFEHIRAPLEASEKAAKTIMARLNQVISIGGISLAFGKVLNKETAAALHILEQTKHVLDLALDADQRTLLKAIEKYIRTVAEDLHDMLEQRKIHYKDVKDDLENTQLNEEEARRAKAKADLLSWVSQVNYSSNYDAAQLRTCENDQSGDWFLKSRNFRDWSKATSRFGLLVTGISGAGKTIMCSKAISHVLHNRSLNDGKANIVYFFFDFNDIAKQSVEGMVRSLIYQLVAKADGVPKTVQNLYSKHQSAPSVASAPRPEEWQKVLIALLQDTERPFVFIDALDECAESESQDLQETIQKLFKKGGAHAKWLLTARPSPRLLSFLQASGFVHSSMKERAINGDIELHLEARLENDAKLSSFGPKAKEMIISSIISKSAGMFRYAECQLSVLSKLKDRRVKKIREVLDKMPESLQSTYSQILHELHSSDDWPILERTLALVSYSARPVTIREVAEFAILEDEMTTIQSEERFEDFGDILSLISSLIDVQDGHLALAHKSVQEFLNAEPETSVSWWLKDSILYEGADLYIAKRCLQYLSFPQRPACEFKEYRDVKNPNAKYLARLLSDYPLLDYAASRWAYHVRSEEVRKMVAEEMRNTLPLTAEPNLWKAWLLLQRADIWETRVQLARLLCRQKNEGEPFELPADEKKEGVARRNENTAVADQSRKYSDESPSEREGRKGMELPSLEDENGKTMEEIAFQLMRHIRREEDGMSLRVGYIPNDERNRRKNEGGPFELASGINGNDSGKGVDAAALMRQIRREEAAALPKTASRDDRTHVKGTKIPASSNRNRLKEVKVNADSARPHLAPLKPVFGVSLGELFHRDNTVVPTIVYQCVQAVDLFGLDTEGIYRTSGFAPHIMEMKAMFNHGSSLVDFRNPANFHHDIASITTLLKHFLRDLPDPLLTNSQYKSFIQAARIDDDIVCRDSLHAIINFLPDPNYATLRVLTFHLNRVAQHSEKNGMTPSNLAICFGPTFMGQKGPSPGRDIKDAIWEAKVVETILNNAFQIFDDDELDIQVTG